MQQVEPRLVGPDVGQLVQRGDLHAGGVAGVAAAVQEVAGHQHHVEEVLELRVGRQLCGKKPVSMWGSAIQN